VDYKALGLADLGRPEGYLARPTAGWFDRWPKAKVDEVPVMDEVHAWLRERCPRESAATLVHNDYKLDNVMRDGPTRMPTSPSFASRSELVARYARASGRDVPAIGSHHVLGLFHPAAMAAEILTRFHRGQTRDQRFAALRGLIPVVAAMARARALSQARS
jgi:aminoglycoside phosphotransferase (APT) family kinase protein